MLNHFWDTGLWASGYCGTSTNLKAELFAILHGLNVAWDAGYRFIVCESDSATALRLIKENNNPFHPYSPLISQIQRLVTQQWDVSFTHTLREGNTVADWLAKTGATHDSYFIAWRECPAQLQSSVLADSLGVSKLRL